MSASNKKKLRKEQEADKLTEKQLTAQKEAKKISLYTTLFVVTMAIILVVAVTIGVSKTISASGIREKNTVAMTVNGHELNNAELNYFYVDSINNFISQYGSYAAMFGLDITKPLDEQMLDEEAGTTWADDFLETAKHNAKAVYAITDEAKAQGFTLPEEEKAELEAAVSNLELYGMMNGFANGEEYLKAMYGNGSTLESYEEYMILTSTFSAYQQSRSDSLTYDAAELKAADGPSYSGYNYNTYYIAASRFLEGGTTAEDGTTTYTDEETAASVTAAEAAAKALAAVGTTTVEELDAAIAAMDINAESDSAASSAHEATLLSSVSTVYADWLSDASRKEGDISYFASTYMDTDADGNEIETTSGYTVVLYLGTEDNGFKLKDVRHILVPFSGGTTDPTTGVTTYSDEEKAAAKESAEEILADFTAGEATDEAFAALAAEKSTDTGSAANGGLYENVYPGQMVVNFENWCYDESRKPGDTGIVESTYGYHIMYFVGDSQLTYRNYLIENDLRDTNMNEWYTSLVEAAQVTEGNTDYINKDIVLNVG